VNIRPILREGKVVSFEAFAGKLNGRKYRKRYRISAFDSEKQARAAAERWVKEKAKQLNSHATYGAILDERILSQVSEALELLSPIGVSLIEAVRGYVREHKKPEKPVQTGITFRDAATLFQKNRQEKGGSKIYLSALKIQLNAFSDEFGDYGLDDISTEMIEKWLDTRTLTAVSRTNWRRDLGMVFRFATARGHATNNPAALLAQAVRSDGEINILQVDDAKKLFEALQKRRDSVARAAIVFASLSCWAGLRSSEILLIDRRNIQLSDNLIEVPTRVSKTRQRRLVTISGNLHDWLREYLVAEERIISVTIKAVRRMLIACAPVPLLRNVFRHSWFSYHLAAHQNQNLTQLEGGHFSPDVMYRHYRALVTRTAAERWFSIKP
jgi:site-specific recombinase XerD